jgi:hypothetical protein
MGNEGRPNIIAAIRHSLSIIFSFVLVRHLPKPAQHVPVVEYSPLEIAGSAERDGAGVPEEFPLPLRRLYCDRRTCAVNSLSGRKGTVDEIKSQCHETCDFGHGMLVLRPSPDLQSIMADDRTHCVGADE